MVSFKHLKGFNTSLMKSRFIYGYRMLFVVFTFSMPIKGNSLNMNELCSANDKSYILVVNRGTGYDCDNSINLVSNSPLENSIKIEVNTSNKYTCVLFRFENGQYLEIDSLNGYGKSTVVFDQLDSEKLYKIITEFESENPMCIFKQISAIRL